MRLRKIIIETDDPAKDLTLRALDAHAWVVASARGEGGYSTAEVLAIVAAELVHHKGEE